MHTVQVLGKNAPDCTDASSSRGRTADRQRGFTLIELMVVVGIVAIVAALAEPSLDRLIVSNRLRAAVNDWTLSMQFARAEAARQNVPVTLCPSNDGVNCTASNYEAGWIVKTQLPAVAGTLLQDTLPKQRLTMTPAAAANGNITFLPNGLPIGNFNGLRIVVRDDPAEIVALSRHICVARSGRIRVFTDDQFMALPAC